jgi:hypothetical protein
MTGRFSAQQLDDPSLSLASIVISVLQPFHIDNILEFARFISFIRLYNGNPTPQYLASPPSGRHSRATLFDLPQAIE